VVLEDINLKLAPGENVSIIGRNGVGKTTLLATIMGHTRLHKGELLLDTRSLNRMPIYARAARGIGYVPQEREIFPSLSVRENLEIAARPGHWTQARACSRCSRTSRSGCPTWAISSPAASSRCFRRPRAADQTHPCCSWTSRPRGLPPSLSKRSPAVLIKAT